MKLPFNKPYTGAEEEKALKKALREGHLRGDGPYTKNVQKLIEDSLNIKHVLLTTSCTHALEMAAIILNLEPGNEVIMPLILSLLQMPSYCEGQLRFLLKLSRKQ